MDLKDYFGNNYKRLNNEEPFTPAEKEQYNANDRNFIQYLQIMFKSSKEEAIRKFHIYKNDIITNAKTRKDFQKGIKDMYEGLLRYSNAPDTDLNRKSVSVAKAGEFRFNNLLNFKYRNSFGDLPIKQETKDRFKLIDKKSRRYLDTLSGKEISRRERDKQIINITIEQIEEEENNDYEELF